MNYPVLTMYQLASKYYKTVCSLILVAVLLAIAITFILPKSYFASAEWTSMNSQYTDKSFLNGENLQTLISVYGSSEDNNRLITIAYSEKVFSFLIDSFQLAKQYQIDNSTPMGKYKLMNKFRKDVEIFVTERNAISTNVIAKNPQLAADIANAICKKVNQISKSYIENIYKNNIKALLTDTNAIRKQQNEKLISQYQTALLANSPALFVLQEATPQVKPYQPKLSANLITAFFASLAFCIVWIAYKEKNNFFN